MRYLFTLGRQAALSALELERLLTSLGYSPKIVEQTALFLVVETQKPVPAELMDRLGGSDRIVEVFGVQPDQWDPTQMYPLLSPIAAKKIWLGVSVLGSDPHVDQRWLKRWAHEIKTLFASQGHSLKFVLPKGQALRLNSAQVIFNQLTEDANIEIVLAQGAHSWYVGRTIAIQDIQAYEQRDTGKAVRAAKVGMLPPKLAQIMINVAVSHLQPSLFDKLRATAGAAPLKILDPFCGTGTILQEGWLMDYQMLGSDKEPTAVSASQRNMAALAERFQVDPQLYPQISQHDVRHPFSSELVDTIDAIVTEPYLGTPLISPLSPTEANRRQRELATLYIDFFRQSAAVLKKGGGIVLALPAFRVAGQKHLSLFPVASLLDEVSRFGYVQLQLRPTREDLLYARPDAFVGRELTVWHKS